jgi:hypothetical protein
MRKAFMDISALDLSMVNAYLLKGESGFLLVDTGPANQRANLERQLVYVGCRRGNWNVMVARSLFHLARGQEISSQ